MYLALIIYFAVHSLRAKRKNKKSTIYTMELKDRFLKYVSFDTQSDESSETFLDRENSGCCSIIWPKR